MTSGSSQMGMKEVCLIDAGITNIRDLALTEDTETLNLHCNSISTITNIQHLWRLHHLDLSSNVITYISHLEGLTELRTLNLSCNLISEVSGLRDLRSLLHLNLSYNCISSLKGLCQLWGPEYHLKSLELQGNNVSSVEELIECLSGLTSLEELTLEREGSSNPVCQLYGYRTALLNSLPQLKVLDGRDRHGRLIQKEISLNDIPGLEQYLDFLVSSDGNTSASQESPLQILTPKIDQLLDKFRRGALRSDDQTTSNPTTSHSEIDNAGRSHQSKKVVSGERVPTAASDHENRIMELEKKLSDMLQKSRVAMIPASAAADSSESVTQASRLKAQRGRQKKAAKRDTEPTDESEQSETSEKQTPGQLKKSKRKSSLKRGRIQRQNSSSEPQSDPSQKHHLGEKPSSSERKGDLATKSTVEQDSEKLALLQELEEERVRRWKAEQAAVKLADRIKILQSQASEGQEIQNVAVHATSRLKEVLMREKEHRLKLEEERDNLREKLEKLVGKLEETADSMERKDKALEAMETTAKRMESERLQQQAHEAKQLQEYQLKLGATSRELDLLRTQVKNSDTKIQQLQELLATREQEHRNEIKHLYRLDSKELQEVLNQQLARERESHRKELNMNEEKIDQLSRQYADLEDEFRLALRLEAERFQQVHGAYETLKQETSRYREATEVAINKEKRSSALVTELTVMVKEQKVRISELSKSKQDTAARSKEHIQSMEAQLEESRKKLLHFEAVCQEKTRLKTQLVAQESVIEGLKAERKLWGQELAQQGSSLAQDRGRLEAKIEALTAEVASLKKQQVADNEGLKIKTKVIDDQTDTIRKLKEAVKDRDDQIKKVREESLEMQRAQEEIINTEQTANQDLKEQVEHLQQRKDALKEQVQELQLELDESQRAYRALDRKWKDKGDLISQLEEQVRQVKKTFDEKEAKLKMERDKALEQERAAKERVQTLDNAFRKQMEAAQQGFDESMDLLRQEKDAEIEEANQKVIQVEDEMRHLLSESAHQKKVMEEKLKKVTQVFSDLQQDLG